MPGDVSDFTALIRAISELKARVSHLETMAEVPAAGGGDADTVDGFHASAVPAAGTLLALDGSGEWPADVVGFGALTLPAQVWATIWQSVVAVFFNDNDILWDSDTQTTSVTLRRKSDVVVIGAVGWQNAVAGRVYNWEMRWDLDGTPSVETGKLGNQVSRLENTVVLGKWTGVAAGARTLTLQGHKTEVAWQADDVTVHRRTAAIIIIPVD